MPRQTHLPSRARPAMVWLGLAAVLVLCLLVSRPVAAQSVAAAPAASAPAAAASAAARAPNYTVRIDAPNELLPLLRDHLDLERWRDFPGLQPAQLDRLIERAPAQARRLLETEGYFSARVTVRREGRAPQPELIVQVDPGKPSRVDAVDLQVNGPDGAPDAALAAALKRHWTLPEGAVFRDAAWEAAKAGALSRLLSGHWPGARIVDSRATVDPARHAVALRLVLDTGPAYTFGALRVQGLQRYPERIVRNLGPPQPGSRYDGRELLDYQAALQNSPYFRNAVVSADIEHARDGVVPVDVQVTENPAQKIGLGIGYSSDTGKRLQFHYRDLNFASRAWRLSTDLQLQTLQQTESVQLALPRTAQGYDDSVGLSHTYSNIQGLVTRNYTASAQRARTRGNIDTAVVAQYQIESTAPAGAPSDIIHTLSLNASWTRRDVNSILYPSRGTVVNVQLGGAAKALLSSASFLRLYGRGVAYVPLGKSDGLIFRGEVGVVLANGAQGIPQSFLFRAGGANSVRGYAYQSLGLREGNAIVGGRYLLTGSAEFTHWFTEQYGGAVFYDAGNAADTWGGLKPVRGYGAGFRWRSPVGQISVDLAYGQAVHQYRLNFNVGLSF